MRAITVSLVLLASLAAAAAQTAPSLAESINEIKPPSSVRLDPYIRRALLKALSELEESEKITTDFTSTDGTDGSTYGTETIDELRAIDYQTESIPTETSKEGIQIHSFIVNGQAAFANTTPNDVPTYINDNISILSTTSVNVDQVTSTLPTASPFNEIFQTSQTGVNLQQTKNLNSNNDIGGDAKTTANVASTTRVTRPATTSTTTTTTTTTTTPKPTHNDDGQNIEEVNKKDVQVFQAPLVAAFTVHQDANGLPKKVVPLLPADSREPLKHHQILPLSIPQTNNNNLRQQNINNNIRQQQQEFRQQDLRQQEIIQQQLNLQKQLEEKQKFLEEQLRILQQQQKQQEELLRKQQYLLQQKEFERQQFEQFPSHNQLKRQESFDKQRFPNNQAANNFQFQYVQKNVPDQLPVQNNSLRPQTQQVSIQQSVSVPFPNNGAGVQHSNNLGNQQQLPNREAVDFLITLRSHQPEQFPLQDNHLPQGISNFLQPATLFGQAQNFQQNFNQNRPVENGGRQSNRVFRQESGVGNFGFNGNYQRFNNFVPIQSQKFFGSNRQNLGNRNSDLQQLLFETGLNGRNHEDLNIVTKVLSLNHGVPLNNNISNRLPFDSRRHSRTNL